MSYEEKTINNNPFLQFLIGRQWRWARHIIFLFVVTWLVYRAEPHYLAPWDTNNTIFIGQSEIPIGNAYRSYFFDEFVTKKLLSR